jgi:hypothetical protein
MRSRLNSVPGIENNNAVDMLATKNTTTIEKAKEKDVDPVELYLFRVEAKLISLTPENRLVVLEEIRQHLHASISAREELGLSHEAATKEAIARFGDPVCIARQFCLVWGKEESLFPRNAFFLALRCFGGLGIAFGIAALINVTTPYSSLFAGVSIGTYSALFWICPMVAGYRIGRRAPRRAAFATLLALFALMAFSLPLTWLDMTLGNGGDGRWLTPSYLPFLFSLWTLPGCLAVSVTVTITNFRHRKTA